MAEVRETSATTLLTKTGALSAVAVFLVSFILYWMTLAPTVTFVDSGELIVTSATLGVAHPPGFPLYTMLAYLATLLPIGSIAQRVNLASALFAGLASAVMTLAVIEVLLTSPGAGKEKAKSKKAKKKGEDVTAGPIAVGQDTGRGHLTVLLPAIAAGLLLALSRTVWAYATIAEVYTLNIFLIITIVWLMLAWRREVLATRTNNSPASDRRLYIAALIFGLALGVHHVTVALLLPALAVFVLMTEGKGFFMSRRLLYAALISIAGLSVYTYLPVAASRSPLINWTDPSTLERFWWHVSGKQYQVFFDFSFSRITEFFGFASHEFGVVWLPAALIAVAAGLIRAYKLDRTLFWFLLLIILADLAYCLSYEIADDKDAYYMPAFAALVIAAGFGLHWAATLIRGVKASPFIPLALAALAMAAIPAVALISNYGFRDRSQYFIAHDYVDNVNRSVSSRGMVLTGDWQLFSPSLYVREIEGARKDVVMIDIKLLRRSWYYNYLARAYPDVVAKSRDKIDTFLEDLNNFDKNPSAYDPNTALNQRINNRFYDMIYSLAANQLSSGELFITLELADPSSGQDIGLKRILGDRYELVPQGMVFRIGEKGVQGELRIPDFNTRGLNDGTVKFGEDDVVPRSIVPAYLRMITNNGLYLASVGQRDRAIAKYNQALKIDPTFAPARNSLAAILNPPANP